MLLIISTHLNFTTTIWGRCCYHSWLHWGPWGQSKGQSYYYLNSDGWCQILPLTSHPLCPALGQAPGTAMSKAFQAPILLWSLLCCPLLGDIRASVVFGLSWEEAEGQLLAAQLCSHSYNHWVTLSKSLLSIHIMVGTAPYFLTPKKHPFKMHHFLT